MTSMGLCASHKEKEVNIFQVYEHQSIYAYIYEHQNAYKDVGSVVLAWIFCLSIKNTSKLPQLSACLPNDRASVGLLSSFCLIL